MRQLLGKSRSGLFATRTLRGHLHLIRGAVALTMLYAAVGQLHARPGWSVVAGLLALVAMRGCPACWTIGLVKTIQQRARCSAIKSGTSGPLAVARLVERTAAVQRKRS